MKPIDTLEIEHPPRQKLRVSASVREVVDFVLKRGDLGGTGQFAGVNRALEGTRGHQRVQKSRPSGYKSEITVFHEIETPEFLFELKGRIDGVLVKDETVLVEEIKTTSRPWIGPADPLHWGQAKIYAYLFAKETPFKSVNVQITYLELETDHTIEFRQEFTVADLKDFFTSVVNEYLEWIQEYHRWQVIRDESIRRLSFPFQNYRPGQRAFAVAVYRTIQQRGKLFAEAPTGIGKTISVLFPAMKAMAEGRTEKVFYLTAKTIGRSVAEKTMAGLRAGGIRFRTVTLTAKDKICFNNGLPCDVRSCPFAIGYYDRIKPAVRDALAGDSFTRPEIEEIARKHQVCPFELALDLSLWVDAIICDYNYVFDPSVSLKRFFNEDKRSYTVLVDEAHNLVDRAREMFSAELDHDEMAAIKKQIEQEAPACAKSLQKIRSRFTAIQKEEGWLERDQTLVSKTAPASLVPALKKFLEEAERWLLLDRLSEFRQVLLELYFRVNGFLRVLDSFDERYVSIYEKRTGRLRLLCLDPSTQLDKAMKDRGAVIFFSATLRPLDFHLNSLGGGPGDKTVQLGSPFAPEKLGLLVHDRIATSFQARGSSYTAVATSIGELVQGKPGNYLAYFPSYDYLNQVLGKFRDLFPNTPVEAQFSGMNETERETFLGRFRHGSKELLVSFAVLGGIFGEGIDLVGDRLIGVVIVGVGLPQLCLERDLIREQHQAQGKAGFDYAYTFPGMNRVLQAVGRVIRSEEDRGVVLLIDERFRRAQYRSLFPSWWIPRYVNNSAQIKTTLDEFWLPDDPSADYERRMSEKEELVRERGLEPPPLAGPDPKSGASAISPLAQP